MGFDFQENYIDNPEAMLKKTRAKLKKVSVEKFRSQPSQEKFSTKI
jgi:hypothetical protein